MVLCVRYYVVYTMYHEGLCGTVRDCVVLCGIYHEGLCGTMRDCMVGNLIHVYSGVQRRYCGTV